MAWDDLLQQCAHCLTQDELTELNRKRQREEARSATAGIPGASGSGETVQQLLGDEASLSFYDPAEPPAAEFRSIDIAYPTPRLSPAPRMEPRALPWPIPESVFFVYKSFGRADAAAARIPTATAFVLSVPDKRHKQAFRFLVTARHVVDPEWAHCSEKNPASLEIRLNKRSGGIGYEAIPLESGDQKRFFTPADDAADLALIPLDEQLIPNLESYKFIDLPFNLLPNDSELRSVSTEQQIMTAGLMAPLSFAVKNYPIFSSGEVLKMPSNAVTVQCAGKSGPKPLHVWFIHAAVPQGLSGAPVYTEIARGADSIKTPILLGVQSVAWPDRGVAGITPASVLGELVRSALKTNKLDRDFYKDPAQ